MDETVQKVIEQQEQAEVVNKWNEAKLPTPYEFFGFVQADLQILSFLEVSD